MRRLLVAAALALSGCATPYQEMGFMGGVSAQRIDDTTVSVVARGNGYTDTETIRGYVLRKASEVTLAAGFDVFRVSSAEDRSRQQAYYIPGSSTSYTDGQVTAFGNTAVGSATTTTTTSPGYSGTIFRPGAAVTIQMYHGPCPAQHIDNVYCAATVLRYLTPPQSPKN